MTETYDRLGNEPDDDPAADPIAVTIRRDELEAIWNLIDRHIAEEEEGIDPDLGRAYRAVCLALGHEDPLHMDEEEDR